jgi:hypothetical protein
VTTILFNPDVTDEERRARLYSGQVLVYGASPASLALVQHARDLIVEAFGPIDCATSRNPRNQYSLSRTCTSYPRLGA